MVLNRPSRQIIRHGRIDDGVRDIERENEWATIPPLAHGRRKRRNNPQSAIRDPQLKMPVAPRLAAGKLPALF